MEDQTTYQAQENQFGAHHYAPLPVVLTRGEGVYVWDIHDKRYLDMMSAYSALSLGHCHPELVETLTQQAKRLSLVSRAFYTDQLGPFLQRACELSQFDQALPMNTGAEAVETALKAARKWAYVVKGVQTDQAEIIACENNFHGRTIAIVGLSSEPSYRYGFGPFPPKLKVIPYGDAEALARAITPNTAAFLVEPIQGEAGIIVPPDGYLKKCRDICTKNRVLLLCDEIQTGLARTGYLFAYEHDHIKPDGLILGKALGGGLLPVSLFLANHDVMDVFTPGDHGSTFGGNPLAAAVGSKALALIITQQLVKHTKALGDYFMSALQKIASQSTMIKAVRGRGLMIGVEMNPAFSARDIALRLMEAGLLTKETHHTVLRFAPPLIITREQIDEALVVLRRVFDK